MQLKTCVPLEDTLFCRHRGHTILGHPLIYVTRLCIWATLNALLKNPVSDSVTHKNISNESLLNLVEASNNEKQKIIIIIIPAIAQATHHNLLPFLVLFCKPEWIL